MCLAQVGFTVTVDLILSDKIQENFVSAHAGSHAKAQR